MANETTRRGVPAGVWAAAAVISVIAFMVWLSMAAQPSRVVAVEEGDTTEAGMPTGEAITLRNLADSTSAYQGREVTLPATPVAAKMGEQAFWIDLPNQQPFLIKLGTLAVAAGLTVTQGERVVVTGTVLPMSDSVISSWVASGAISEAQEPEAQFAMSFLEASNIRPAPQQ